MIRFRIAIDTLSFLFSSEMCAFQFRSGSKITPRNRASVDSLIWVRSTNREIELLAILRWAALFLWLLDFLFFRLLSIFLSYPWVKNLFLGGKYMKQYLSKLICRRLEVMYSSTFASILLPNSAAFSKVLQAMKMFVSSVYKMNSQLSLFTELIMSLI